MTPEAVCPRCSCTFAVTGSVTRLTCPQCGEATDAPAEWLAPAGVQPGRTVGRPCPFCGKPVRERYMICPHCEKPLLEYFRREEEARLRPPPGPIGQFFGRLYSARFNSFQISFAVVGVVGTAAMIAWAATLISTGSFVEPLIGSFFLIVMALVWLIVLPAVALIVTEPAVFRRLGWRIVSYLTRAAAVAGLVLLVVSAVITFACAACTGGRFH
jgi:hypothetical protein